MKLDLDQYLALPWPDRKRVDRWLRAHGINPDDTFGLELREGAVTADMYGGLTYDGAVIHTWMTVDIKTPFPEVAV